MAGKNYITEDLDFAEYQIGTWKQFILDNPIDKITDRRGEKEMPNGQIVRNAIIATREQIIKTVQDTMEKYLRMMTVIQDLRCIEEAKAKTARAGLEIPARMKQKKIDE